MKLSTLHLNSHAKDKLLRLVKERYDPVNDILTIVSERCPLRKQNIDYAIYLLNVLVSESWVCKIGQTYWYRQSWFLVCLLGSNRHFLFLRNYVIVGYWAENRTLGEREIGSRHGKIRVGRKSVAAYITAAVRTNARQSYRPARSNRTVLSKRYAVP